jgi:succinylglutamate desuccinylase
MKKILFIVCTHGNETAGFDLFLKYPYGKTDFIYWEIIVGNPKATLIQSRFIEEDLNRICEQLHKHKSYEGKRAQMLKQKMANFDTVYDIHTTSNIKERVNDCTFINSIKSLKETYFIKSSQVIYDKKNNKQYITSLHPNGITLEYTKTTNVQHDRNRIFNDFKSIINQKKINKNKNISDFFGLISQTSARKLKLNWQDFNLISDIDIKKLKLPPGQYFPVFVNPPEQDTKIYSAINVIKQTI